MKDIASVDIFVQATLIVQIVLLFLMAMKTLHLMRVFEKQGMLVLLLFTCLTDMTPFLIILCFFLYVIFSMYKVTGANLGDESDYPDMNPSLAIFTQVFRNSLGDIAMPGYKLWCRDQSSYCNPVFVGMIWSLFMFHNILVLIMLLNFLISIIG